MVIVLFAVNHLNPENLKIRWTMRKSNDLKQARTVAILAISNQKDEHCLSGIIEAIKDGDTVKISFTHKNTTYNAGKFQFITFDERIIEPISRTYKNFCYQHKMIEDSGLVHGYLFTEMHNGEWVRKIVHRMCEEGASQFASTFNKPVQIERHVRDDWDGPDRKAVGE
jgi:hypothetical protein